MAIVLSLVILGWLIAFALGAQTGFDSEPTVAKQSSVAQPASTKPVTYREPASAS